MSEEYILPGGFSSLDIDICECCYTQYYYEELTDYRGEKMCKKCLDETKADIQRDQMKDDRYE